MAGESASEVARRHREKIERLERRAELWERGAAGEQATAEALSVLPAETWTVLHDRRWPGRQLANVDHVAIGPGGVFVIDSKNWSGRVTVERDVLRQNGRSREKSVAGAADAALAIGALLHSASPAAVVPVLCFVRDEPLSGWARDVMVCSTSNLIGMLLSRPAVLSVEQVRAVGHELDLALRSASAPPTWRPRHAPAPSASVPHGDQVVIPPLTLPTKREPRRRRRGAGPLIRLVGMLLAAGLMIGMLKTGAVTSAADWVTERMTDGLTTQPVTPTDKDRQQKKNEKRERQSKNFKKNKPGTGGNN